MALTKPHIWITDQESKIQSYHSVLQQVGGATEHIIACLTAVCPF
jgi:hypothetical protein